MSDITLIDDSEQSSLVTNGLAKNGEMYLKKAGSTDAGSIVVYDSGAWKTFANEGGAFVNGSSLHLDGTNDYLTIPSNITGSSYSTQDWTFSMFLKADSINVSPSGPFSIFLAGTGATPYVAFVSGVFRYINFQTLGANGPTITGNWQHLMITNDSTTGSSSNAASLYIDGSFVGYTKTWNNCNGIRNIGRYNSGYNSDLIVDEISIFDSIKSVSDVQTGGVPNDLTSLNPVLWYRCGDGDTSPTLTNNGSGSSLDGTMVNVTTFSSDVPS
jgi:hypothetical protein